MTTRPQPVPQFSEADEPVFPHNPADFHEVRPAAAGFSGKTVSVSYQFLGREVVCLAPFPLVLDADMSDADRVDLYAALKTDPDCTIYAAAQHVYMGVAVLCVWARTGISEGQRQAGFSLCDGAFVKFSVESLESTLFKMVPGAKRQMAAIVAAELQKLIEEANG